MKFTIIFGSPRKNGNTAHLLAPFMDELKKKCMPDHLPRSCFQSEYSHDSYDRRMVIPKKTVCAELT